MSINNLLDNPQLAISSDDIGEWKVKKLKYVATIITGNTPPRSSDENYCEDGYIWIKPDELKEFEPIIDSNEKISERGYGSLRIIQKGSALVCCIGNIGKFGYAGRTLSTNQQINSVIWNPLLIQERYGLYLISSLTEEFNKYSEKVVVSILNKTRQENIKVKLPSYNVQSQIATYLDHKTRQIDNLIAKKQRLIELLQEERTALINQAVTKGLDPHVPMKDSGIEWLGEIPEHWETKPLKHIATIILGKMLTNEDKGGYHLRPYLRAQNINWLKVNANDIKSMWFSEKEMDQYLIKLDDILVSEGGEVGRTCIWKEEIKECYIQNSVHKVSLKNGNIPIYFLYQFYCLGNKGHFDSIVSRVSIAHLTREKLKEVYFIEPPIEEQSSISRFIEERCSQYELTISRIEKEIELFNEYKASLINEAVTGKIDVREYQIDHA